MNIKDLLRLRQSGKKFQMDEKRRFQQEATGKTRDPESIRIKSVTPRAGSGAAGQFEDSEVDLAQIGQAYHSDAYISRAINKVVGLMFKEGWTFNSMNQEALEYIETRFRLMEESTDRHTDELLRELGSNYVLYANAPTVKTRGQENLAGIKATGYYGGEPISGLFPISPESFQVMRDEFGNIENYAAGDGATNVEFAPEDVLHMTYHRPTGRAYGVPYITTTLRDVLVLRQIEEIVSKMLYRNLYPLQTYTVGTDKPGFEAQPGEVEDVQAALMDSSLDSMLVIPERHKVDVVSSGSDFLDASNYLKYFRQRVFTGLGVSESTMGIGDTANRSTSDNQSSDLIDLVKDFQQNFAAEFQKVVDELLFEGGYDPTLNKEDRVVFTFTEIEQAAKIARENHEIQKFMANVQGLGETRNNMGYEPITDMSDFYAEITGRDAADNTGTIENRNQPENQHGKADGPTKDSMQDQYSGKKMQNIEKGRLTSLDQVVTLPPDDASLTEETVALSAAWQQTREHFNRSKEHTEKQLAWSFQLSLPESLFSTKEERNHFATLLAGAAFRLAEGTNPVGADALYRFEEHIIGSYQRFSILSREGGMA